MRGEGSDRAHRTPTAQTVMKFVVCRKTVAGREGFFLSQHNLSRDSHLYSKPTQTNQKTCRILMSFWITSADGIYFGKAYKYVL